MLTVKITSTGKHFLKGDVIGEGMSVNVPQQYSNPNQLVSLGPGGGGRLETLRILAVTACKSYLSNLN